MVLCLIIFSAVCILLHNFYEDQMSLYRRHAKVTYEFLEIKYGNEINK